MAHGYAYCSAVDDNEQQTTDDCVELGPGNSVTFLFAYHFVGDHCVAVSHLTNFIYFFIGYFRPVSRHSPRRAYACTLSLVAAGKRA